MRHNNKIYVMIMKSQSYSRRGTFWDFSLEHDESIGYRDVGPAARPNAPVESMTYRNRHACEQT